MAKQAERSEASKQKLMAAASKLFNERSINDVGIREICAEAGVTTGTYYHHYKTKTDIINAIHSVHDEQFGDILSKLAKKKGPYCDRIIEFFVKTMAPLIESDGIEFTLHRMFVTRKHSDESYNLYIGIKNLIDLAKEKHEIQGKYDTSEINDYLFIVFRGIVYDWCIMPDEDRKALPALLERAMSTAIRAYQN